MKNGFLIQKPLCNCEKPLCNCEKRLCNYEKPLCNDIYSLSVTYQFDINDVWI